VSTSDPTPAPPALRDFTHARPSGADVPPPLRTVPAGSGFHPVASIGRAIRDGRRFPAIMTALFISATAALSVYDLYLVLIVMTR
jgi:hypothetical protein